jgi:hypothetical protein
VTNYVHDRRSALPTIADSDPWCQGKAEATRALVVVAVMAALTSLILSVMAALGIKTPTWDGEGKETTLVTPVACSLCSFVTLLPAVVEWQRMVNEYDTTCRATMQITTFTCITSSVAHKTAMAAVPFAAASFCLWRLTHSYSVRYAVNTSCRGP